MSASNLDPSGGHTSGLSVEIQNSLKHIALLEEEADLCISENRRSDFVELANRSLTARQELGPKYSTGSVPHALCVRSIDFLHQLALEDFSAGRRDLAKRRTQEAETLLLYPALQQEQHQLRITAANLNLRALLGRAEKDYDFALFLGEKALHITRKLPQGNEAVNVYLNVGAILSELGRHSDSLSIFLEAITVLKNRARYLEKRNADRTQLRTIYSSLVVAYNNLSVEQKHLRMEMDSESSRRKALALARAKLGDTNIITNPTTITARSESQSDHRMQPQNRPHELSAIPQTMGLSKDRAAPARSTRQATSGHSWTSYPPSSADTALEVFRTVHPSTTSVTDLVVHPCVGYTSIRGQFAFSTLQPTFPALLRSDQHTTVGAAALGTISAHLMRGPLGQQPQEDHVGRHSLTPTLVCSQKSRPFTSRLQIGQLRPTFVTLHTAPLVSSPSRDVQSELSDETAADDYTPTAHFSAACSPNSAHTTRNAFVTAPAPTVGHPALTFSLNPNQPRLHSQIYPSSQMLSLTVRAPAG